MEMGQRDLAELKQRFPHASWEVIARRWAEFKPAALTIFDNGAQTNRIIPPNLTAPPRPTPAELELIRETYALRTNMERVESPLTMTAWFIDDGRGVERVILLTEVEDYY